MEKHTSGSGMSPWAERPVADWSGRFLRGSILPDSGEPWVINGIKDSKDTHTCAANARPRPLPNHSPTLRLGARDLGGDSGESMAVWRGALYQSRAREAARARRDRAEARAVFEWPTQSNLITGESVVTGGEIYAFLQQQPCYGRPVEGRLLANRRERIFPNLA